MAAQQVKRLVEGLVRVVLAQLLEAIGKLVGANAAAQEVKDPGAEGIIHRGVQLFALEVVAQLAVGQLVGGVLPDLADKHAVGTLGHHGGLDLGDELVGKLVGHVKAPAARAQAHPLANNAVLAANELVVVLGVGVERGHVLVAPPAGVGIVVVEAKPVAVRGLLAVDVGLPGADLGIVAVAVEVDRIAPAVVEDAVQDDGDAAGLGRRAQVREVLLGAQHGIDAQVVGRVVAVVAVGREDRVEVDDRNAQALQVVELLGHALEGPAVEVPASNAQVIGRDARVRGRGIPVLDQGALHAVQRLVESGRRALLPILAASKAVGEDLVDHGVLVPVELGRAGLKDRDLERGRLAVGEGALARGPALVGAVAPHGSVGGLKVEAVPHQARAGRRVVRLKAQVVALGLAAHLDKLFAGLVGPDAQGAERDLAPNIYRQRDGAAQLDGTEWISIVLLGGYVTCSHV